MTGQLIFEKALFQTFSDCLFGLEALVKSASRCLRPIADCVRIEPSGPRGSRFRSFETFMSHGRTATTTISSGTMEGRVKRKKEALLPPFGVAISKGLMNVANGFLRAVARALQWSAIFLMRPLQRSTTRLHAQVISLAPICFFLLSTCTVLQTLQH